ncbi:MAG: GHKL domain-containing protein [Bacillota bacterium]|nr:GHKL domain-containing protein [Bacillota bacterium]
MPPFAALILNTAICAVLMAFFYPAVLKRRYNLAVTVLSILGVMAILSVISNYIYEYLPLKALFQLPVLYITLSVLFKDRPLRKLTALMLQYFGLILAEMSQAILVEFIVGVPLVEIFSQETVSPTITINFFIIFSVILLIIAWLMNKDYSSLSPGYMLRFFFFPLSQFIVITYLFYLLAFKSISMSGGYLLAFCTCILLCIIADVLMIRTVKDVAQKSKVESQNHYLRMERDMQLQHYQALSEYQDKTRALRHDILNHVQTIKLLLEQEEIEKADYYADELTKRFDKITTIDYCDNKVVDAVLHNKAEYCRSQNIPISIKVAVDEETSIDDLDLMCVFSNLLDNAIESCKKIDTEKNIDVTAGTVKGYLVIKVENTVLEEPNFENTGKKDKYSHGMGLSIVKETAEKYQGALNLSFNSNIVTATVSLKI